MRYIRIALSLIFALLALSAWLQVVGPTDDPPPLRAWQTIIGFVGAAAAWGTWRAARWAPAAAVAYGVVTGSMIVALGPMLDLDQSARGGLWTGGIAVLLFGLGSAAILSRRSRGAPTAVPTFEQWAAMSEDQRRQEIARWNPYGGEGFDLVSKISDDFRSRYGHLRGLEISAPGVYHGGYWVISIRTPFIFDQRELPNVHLGIPVHRSGMNDLPPEFEEGTRTNEYVWAPEHYEQFVDRAAPDIRRELGRPDMSRDEMLAALVGMPFASYVTSTQR